MDDLTTLLHDAVEDVEPSERLAAIRRQTRSRRPRRWGVVGGAALATAAVVIGIAIAARPTADTGPGPSTAPDAITDEGRPEGKPIPVYYAGETPQGLRLFREFRYARDGVPSRGGVSFIGQEPYDPDYINLWPSQSLTQEPGTDTVARVEIAEWLVERPDGMSEADARLALQQVVYTAQADAQLPLEVEFLVDGRPADRVLGIPLAGPVARAPQLETLALVSISNPVEGRQVVDSFSADGVASSFEGTVAWELRDSTGKVVLEYSAQGTMEDHLTPWATGPIDVSGLAPGTYVFEARTDDPTGGEFGGPTTDTRTITIL